MGMKKLQIKEFGALKNGKCVRLFIMENEAGMSASVTEYGANLVRLTVPDKEGNLKDVVLGYEDVSGYEEGTASIGAVVGRNANRIGGAAFALNGVTYELEKNDNGNNLHSGPDVYNKRLWELEKAENEKVTFLLHSADGDQGYPGNLEMRVTYELTEENELRITYDGVADQDTVINMTNHSYFNLNGHDSGTILKHRVMLDADFFTRADAESIPTGELVDVTGTPMDFRKAHAIEDEIDADYEAIRFGGGYDHNWVLKNNGKFDKVAQAEGEQSGIVMEVWSDLPGIQMYTANFLDKENGKDGVVYEKRSAVCFETQYFPDAVNKKNFASPVWKKGEKYHTVTAYKFV